MFRLANPAALAASFLVAGLLSAQAGTFTLSTDSSTNSGADLRFNALCGGTDSFDCEYTVGDVRAGNRAGNGDSELAIYDRLNYQGAVAGATAQASPFAATTDFLVSYRVGSGLTLAGFDNAASFNLDLGSIPTTASNPDTAPQSLVIRVRNASVNNLSYNGVSIPDQAAVARLSDGGVGYLYLGLDNLTSDWDLSGTLQLAASGNGSRTAMQVKVTDLAPSPVPLPAGGVLLVAALGALGLRRRFKAALG